MAAVEVVAALAAISVRENTVCRKRSLWKLRIEASPANGENFFPRLTSLKTVQENGSGI
jgi:hypothetical protein